MAVLPTMTEPKCKICASPHRAEIDALLEARSKRPAAFDADGKRITGQYVIDAMAAFGIVNPNKDNLTNHWKRHCEVVDELTGEEREAALASLNQEMLDILDSSDGTVDGDLRAVFKLGMHRIKTRIIKGQDAGVSVDQALKASAELTKRQDNESRRDLLSVLGGGIMAALAQPKQPKQIESAAEVIEQEAVEA